MNYIRPLQPDTSYHIFNHANGFENVFREEKNYRFFLDKYRLHIAPIAETYAYCLMPNHFHLVVRIRKRAILEKLPNFSKVSGSDKGILVNENESRRIESVNFGKDFATTIEISDREIEKQLSKQFANLFSSYTQSFNKVYHRMGSLFIKNFKRNPISDKIQFLNTVIYTHRNPIHHGFCTNYDEWEYSSYNEIVNGTGDYLELVRLLKMFGSIESFKEMHKRNPDEFIKPDDL